MGEIAKINPASLKQPTKSYSNGILVPLPGADLMFVTGQVAQDFEGNVVAPTDAAEQTRFIFDRISDILKDGGRSLDEVVKALIFVTSMDCSSAVSEVRNRAFINSKPVSTLVEVSRLVKPGCCVEIEVIAAKL